jgi:hypothetical protein
MKGSFWWRDNLIILHLFKGFATVSLGKGDTCLFWLDLLEGQIFPGQIMPELFSFAKNQYLSVHKL